MNERDDDTSRQPEDEHTSSVRNPFAEGSAGDIPEDEKPQLNISKKRAAALGTSFGLLMVLLLLVCFLLSAALSSCINP